MSHNFVDNIGFYVHGSLKCATLFTNFQMVSGISFFFVRAFFSRISLVYALFLCSLLFFAALNLTSISYIIIIYVSVHSMVGEIWHYGIWFVLFFVYKCCHLVHFILFAAAITTYAGYGCYCCSFILLFRLSGVKKFSSRFFSFIWQRYVHISCDASRIKINKCLTKYYYFNFCSVPIMRDKFEFKNFQVFHLMI